MKHRSLLWTSRVQSSLVLASFAVAACGSDAESPRGPAADLAPPPTTPTTPPPTPTTPPLPPPVEVGTHPRFDPAASDLPFNTDLAFAHAASSDGTAHLGLPTDATVAAVNQLDGFSTSSYFDVMISGSVDPTTVTSKSVLVVALDSGGEDALPAANIVGAKGLATYDVTVTSLDGGMNNVIRVRPTAPLQPRTKYLVALTNDVKDAAGKALVRGVAYDRLRDESAAITDDLEPVRTAIQWSEALASQYLAEASGGEISEALARDSLVLTYTFTTTDPTAALVAMASPRAEVMVRRILSGHNANAALSLVQTLEANGVLPTPKARRLALSGFTGIDFASFGLTLSANVGKVYTGYIELPYYQTAPAGLPLGGHLERSWAPDPALATALGETVPADVGGGSNVTYRYPFAAETGKESIPLQVTMPADGRVPGYAGAANCGQIYAATGYPVVIYVHGVGADRTSGITLAHALASSCVATVAIDLPLHGVAANSPFVDVLNVERSKLIPFSTIYGAGALHERHFDIAGPPGSPAPMSFTNPTPSDGSGAQFFHIRSLTNVRDNGRQAVMDLLNLNASLTSLNGSLTQFADVGLDVNRVMVVGVSYGGMVATVFVTVNQLAIAREALVGLTSQLAPVKGVVASGAGSQLWPMLVSSPTYGPVLEGALAAAGHAPGASKYERFLYAGQSAMDAADPVSFAGVLASLGVPILAQQINDDGVIPNKVPGAPLAGTEPLASLLDTTQLGVGSAQLGRGWVKLTGGGNSSLVVPQGGAPQVTAEMQAQVLAFVLGNGAVNVGSQAPENIDAP